MIAGRLGRLKRGGRSRDVAPIWHDQVKLALDFLKPQLQLDAPFFLLQVDETHERRFTITHGKMSQQLGEQGR